MTTIARWRATWRALGVSTADMAEHAALLQRYGEGHRHYHTERHLEECFGHLDGLRPLPYRVGEIEIALWYHDAIYDTHRADNEARSAELAVAALERAAVDAPTIERVRALVLATRHEAPPGTPDAALLTDVDLAILAAEDSRFDEYEREIREEYAWVPAILFRQKRRAVLEGFLARERIYASGLFPDWDARARANIARSLGRD